jgi:hypothetical protein
MHVLLVACLMLICFSYDEWEIKNKRRGWNGWADLETKNGQPHFLQLENLVSLSLTLKEKQERTPRGIWYSGLLLCLRYPHLNLQEQIKKPQTSGMSFHDHKWAWKSCGHPLAFLNWPVMMVWSNCVFHIRVILCLKKASDSSYREMKLE